MLNYNIKEGLLIMSKQSKKRDNMNKINRDVVLRQLLKKYTKKHLEILDMNEGGSAVLVRHKQNGQPFSHIEWEKRRPHKCSQPFWINKNMLIAHLETIGTEDIFKKIATNPILMSATACPQCWNSYKKYIKLLERWEDENF